MVGTNVGSAITARFFTDAGAAVPANIVHSLDIARLGPRHNDRVLANLDELVVSRNGNFARVQGVNPAFENEMLEFLLMHEVRAIEIRIHSVVRANLFRLQLVTHALEGIVYRGGNGVHGVSRKNS